MNAPDIKTPLPGPKAKAIIERDGRFVSPSYTRDYPFVIARGQGAVVEDVDMADNSRLARLLKFILVQSPSYSLRGGTPEVLRGIIARGLGLR